MATAWLGVYQVLLWYERTDGGAGLPHIIDADKLRQASGSRQWIDRAQRVHQYLGESLGCPSGEVPDRVDLLMRSAGYVGLQRQNPLGIAFAELTAHILRKFGDVRLSYRTEVPAAELFPAIKLQSRSRNPKIDVASFRDGKLAAIVTTKWSIRHDRLTDVIDEAISYKSAAMRLGQKLPCFFVTNEFDPARLDKLIGADVVDEVVHVHPKLVTEVCKLNGRLDNMKDF